MEQNMSMEEDVKRIADALERIADEIAPKRKPRDPNAPPRGRATVL